MWVKPINKRAPRLKTNAKLDLLRGAGGRKTGRGAIKGDSVTVKKV